MKRNPVKRISKKRLRALAAQHVRRAGAGNTDRAYRGRWETFVAWVVKRRLPWRKASADTVNMYLVWLAEQGRRESTIRGALAAIRHHYNLAEGIQNGAMDPTVGRCLRSVARQVARPQDRALPLRAVHLAAIVQKVEVEGAGDVAPGVWARDKAVLLLGWGAALRRSELARLLWQNVTFLPDGVEDAAALAGVQLFITRSKRDQLARGTWVGIEVGKDPATCPVRALWRWRQVQQTGTGPIFVAQRGYQWNLQPVHPSFVSRVVKQYVTLLGEDAGAYSAHSLRAGWATDMLALGIPEPVVMSHLRHRDKSMLRVYYRPDGFPTGGLTARAGL